LRNAVVHIWQKIITKNVNKMFYRKIPKIFNLITHYQEF
jgi:hypothetical protein